ncbi:2,3-bisphosphoglycerate-independent phosphoglycerate mutase [Candidatus Bathyarchaeota archaeon]|nr:2,3-bisphosphoglycerate-independent phosphoglycerate mutase [Candidatus Bathyarchaeota archaeon]
MTKLLYIVIDGLGDLPLPELQNRTPLEAAQTPNLDVLAANGKLGLMYTVERGIAPESDVAVMSILGYDPAMYYTGRGPLEAYGAGLRLKDGDLALRCNFATIDSRGRIVDRRAGRNLTTAEAAELSRSINSEIRLNTVASEFEFRSTIGHRAVLIIKRISGLLSGNITNTDPAYARAKGFGVAESKLGVESYIEECKPLDDSYEAKLSAELVNEFTKKTISLLSDHPVNLRRRVDGKLEANGILSRDAGSRLPNLFNIKQKYSVDFACLAEMPVEKAIARLAGMSVIEVPPPSGNLAHDSRLKAERLLQNLGLHEVFYVHIKGPDEPAHDGDCMAKKRSIEEIDREFFGKLLGSLSLEKVLFCVTADHSTPCSMKAHSGDPVPILISGKGIESDGLSRFCESECAKGSLGVIDKGLKLIPILVSLLRTGRGESR